LYSVLSNTNCHLQRQRIGEEKSPKRGEKGKKEEEKRDIIIPLPPVRAWSCRSREENDVREKKERGEGGKNFFSKLG